APRVVVADLDIIRHAPPEMTASGYADLQAKITALRQPETDDIRNRAKRELNTFWNQFADDDRYRGERQNEHDDRQRFDIFELHRLATCHRQAIGSQDLRAQPLVLNRFAQVQAHATHQTFRDDMVEGAAGHWAGHIGTDLIGGPAQDETVPDGWVEMYLPIALRDRVAEARLDDGSPMAEPAREILSREGPPPNEEPANAARLALVLISGAVLALVLAALAFPRAELLALIAQLGLRALVLMFSVFGLVVVPLALLSRVPNLSPNYNAFLFVPFDLIFFGLTKALVDKATPLSRPLARYLTIRTAAVCLCAGLLALGMLTQKNQAFVASAALYTAALSAIAWKSRLRPRLPSGTDTSAAPS
ncbi:MAG: Iron-containing alcohol dehydrogenase, partial [Pseudomonadota bacterium]